MHKEGKRKGKRLWEKSRRRGNGEKEEQKGELLSHLLDLR